jgi:S-adenosylmethionine:tRNA ribosyltransferase-isomerase
MIPASRPLQRPPEARLLAVDAAGGIRQVPRADFVALLRRGDLVVANDAATLPASLHGRHVATGAAVEVRLAGWPSAILDDPRRFHAVVFGAGDYRRRTEDRPPPPVLRPGDRLALGPLSAWIEALLGHPRLVALHFAGTADAIWAGLARHGKPIQYAHVPAPLALWDVWTPIAGPPVAFEPPSAGFALDWRSLAAMRARGIGFATLTHAAGISATGDPELDNLLPFDEPYAIPAATAAAIRAARGRGGRIVAIGTTVVRALEAAGAADGILRAGTGIATGRIAAGTSLRVVDALLTGAHEPGTSHHALLGAFLDQRMLRRVDVALAANHYRTHEFGDSVLIERGVGSDIVSRPMTPDLRRAG